MGLEEKLFLFVFGFILSLHFKLFSFHLMHGNCIDFGSKMSSLNILRTTFSGMFTLQYSPLLSASHFMHFLITNANPISSLKNVDLAICRQKSLQLPALTKSR